MNEFKVNTFYFDISEWQDEEATQLDFGHWPGRCHGCMHKDPNSFYLKSDYLIGIFLLPIQKHL